MKKINDREKTVRLIGEILKGMNDEDLIGLWNNRCSYGKDNAEPQKDQIIYHFSDFDTVCADFGLSFTDVAFMIAHSDVSVGKEYFIADTYNDDFYFLNVDECKNYIPLKEFAEYMTDYVDGCGDKIIQSFLDAIATECYTAEEA